MTETREQRRDIFETLIKRKFGTERGFISRAAKAINVQQGNLSSMLKGNVNIAQKHFEALAKLPDHVPDASIKMYFENGCLSTRLIVNLAPETERIFDIIQRLHTPNYELYKLGPQDVPRLLEKVATYALQGATAEFPDHVKAVMEKMENERREAAKQINQDAKANRNLIADELDPLA